MHHLAAPQSTPRPGVLQAIASKAILAILMPNAGARPEPRPAPAGSDPHAPTLYRSAARTARALGTIAVYTPLVVVALAGALLNSRGGSSGSDSARQSHTASGCSRPQPHAPCPTHAIRPAGSGSQPDRRLLCACKLDSVSRVVECHDGEDASDAKRCPICLESVQGCVRVLACSHRFHIGCIDPWLTSFCTLCPMCKADLAATV